MFATLAAASRTVTVCVLLLALVSCVDVSPAAAAPPPGWQAAGAKTPAWSSDASAAQTTEWQLPSGHARAGQYNIKSGPNPLRATQAASQPREPRTLAAPANAKPLIASRPASGSAATAMPQQHSPSAAIAQTSAAVPAKKPPQSAARPAPAYRAPNPAPPRVARNTPMTRGGWNQPSPRTWQRMNVAMQGTDDLSGEVENLPLPEDAGMPQHDPFMSHPGSHDNHFQNDGYYSSCGPNGCGDGCGCAGPCGCGDACGCGDGVGEPGCGCGCDSCNQGRCCGGDRCCNDCFAIGPGDPESCHSVRMRVPKWQELAFFGGVQGFKNPYDQDRDGGNFGFHEGFNAGFKIPYTYAGYQIGYQGTQNQLNGDENTGDDELHAQNFTTFGLFRRTKDGLQFGAAWDALVDQRDDDAKTFHQIRTELSWLDRCTHEFGFGGTIGMNHNEDEDDDDVLWQVADQYVLFYRFHGKRGGEGRFYGGFTDDSDGILGADMLLPVHDRWSVQTGFTYMIPDAPNGEIGASEEAWNIGLALVWHWGCTARKSHENPYRPLFNVANNGYLLIDRREDN